MDMRVGLYPLTGEPGCGSGGTGTAWKSGNSGSRLQAVYNQGHASVVVLLLADERLDPNIANLDGSRALTRAALNRYDSVVKLADGFNAADLRNVCTEAGMFAIRAERDFVIEEDFMKAVRKVGENKKLEGKLEYSKV